MTPIMLLMAFSLYAGIYSMNNPDGPLALLVFDDPVYLPYRDDGPLAVRHSGMGIGSFVCFAVCHSYTYHRFSAKIYRVGILMYGKKPSIKEMIKWVKYK